MPETSTEKLNRLIVDEYRNSKLESLTADELQKFQTEYPDAPKHLTEFFRTIGWGTIGISEYMIHFSLFPDDVYDEETASDLGNILIVGDDFAGTCDGYDIDNNWKFGSIGDAGRFDTALAKYPTITDLLLCFLDRSDAG